MRLLLLCIALGCGPTPTPDAQRASDGEGTLSTVNEGAPEDAVVADSVVTVRGVFHAGFEASWLQPCGSDEDAWALHPDSGFSQRFGEISRRHVPARRRGTNIYVEVSVTGVLDAGRSVEYGHVSACVGHASGCTGEIRVTETHTMAFLAVDPDEPPTCG